MPFTPAYSAGDVLTAAAVNSIGEAWTAYGTAASFTGSTTSPTGTFTMAARYNRINKNIIVNGKYTFTTVTTTGTGAYYYLAVPVTMHSSNTIGMVIGTWAWYDSSLAAEVPGIIQVQDTGKVRFIDGLGNAWGPASVTIENNDQLKFQFIYEAA